MNTGQIPMFDTLMKEASVAAKQERKQMKKRISSDLPETIPAHTTGYKRSEVGVIPDDWEVVSLGDIFSFSGGYSASREQLSTEGYCYLHYGDIHKSNKAFINVQTEYLDIPKLNVPLTQVPSRSLLLEGDVVFVDASEDAEGTSKHIVVMNPEGTVYISGLHTIVAKSKSGVLDNGYKRYCFQSQRIKRQFYFYAVGTKVSGISKTNIAKVHIPLPPLPEQRAIAAALSDVDALIASLEKLIAKKRDIKTAAMQQLLTGKRRLPGFSGEWEVKRLGDIANLTRDNVIPLNWPSQQFVHFSLPAFDAGQTPVIEYGAEIGSNKFRVPQNAVLVSKLNPRIPRVWAPNLVPDEAVASTEFLVLQPKESISRTYLYVLCSSPSFCEQIELLATGTTGSHQRTNPMDAMDAKIFLPVDEQEQTAIASILSDMDAEIVALERRRDKTRALKQGMMGELLTGRTRLL